MERTKTSLPGIFRLRPKLFNDRRGFFLETYHHANSVALGIGDRFVQDNHASTFQPRVSPLPSRPISDPQSKLCRVVEGEALDVAVDIRVGSPQIGRWTSVLLSTKT